MKQLGQLLVEEDIVTQVQLEQALKFQATSGDRIGDCLIKLEYLTEHALYYFLAAQFNVDFVELSEADFNPQVIALIPKEIANRYQVLPWKKKDNGLVLVASDPSDPQLLSLPQESFFESKGDLSYVVATASSIAEALKKYYGFQI